MKKLKLNKSVVAKLNAIDEMDKVKGGRPWSWFLNCETRAISCKPDSICICVTK